MTIPIRTVKREIRILGLDTCRKGDVFGAVVRGGLFLDGVIHFHLPRKRAEVELARGILSAKHYPELRALIVHDPGHHLDPDVLENLVRLPAMEVSMVNEPRRGYAIFQSRHGTLFHRSPLVPSIADKILSLTWSRGRLPEPARIAHLLSKSALDVEYARSHG